jgi:RHS repeat-associated protein
MAFKQRVRAPVAVATIASFLASLSPARLARADDPPPPPPQQAPEAAGHATSPAGATSALAVPADTAAHAQVTPSEGEVSTETSSGAKPDAVEAKPQRSTLSSELGALGGVTTVQSLPVDGTGKTGVSSQAIALPQGTGKIQGMGESFSTQLSTGVANFTVPFALLPARGGAQPSLSLTYSSGSGAGVAGMGWDVGVAFIARQTDRGLPRYQDPATGGGWAPTQDRFIFNGGQELIPICLVPSSACTSQVPNEVMPTWASGWQYFRPRVEGGFLRFFWSPDHRTWRVQSTSGTSMELGAPLDGSGYTGALETDSTGSHIFRWNLVREYDAYGGANPTGSALPTPVNIVAYRYLQDGGMAHLSDVYDTPPTANPSSAPPSDYAHHTRLSYETRTDPTTSFRRGWQTTERLRLAGVDVASKTFGGSQSREMVRRYHLAYDANYHTSLLASVQMEGRCNTAEDGSGAVSEDGSGALPGTSCPTLPAMTFGYQHVQGYDSGGKQQGADLPGYEPFDERVINFTNSPPNSIDQDVTDLFDVNADGLPDVLVTNPAQFNGNLGVFFNGAGGQPNSFSGAFSMPVSGVPGEDANTINLLNLNVAAGDIDGDGIIDLIHMPQVQTYSVYTPVGSGTSYSWIGRAITTASQQSPKIDFGEDSQNIQLADVNGDGLVDVMYSAGTSLQTFFSLGRYPTGDGQFGYAQWSGPAGAQISNDPVQYCVPYNGLPVQFEDSNTKLADMNGDGLQDLVYTQQGNIVYWPGRGNGYFGTGDPSACPGGTFGQDTGIAMASSPWYSDPNGSTLRLDDVNGDGLDDLVQVGMNYVEIWLNVDGASWTGMHTISNSPPAPSYANRVRLVDANGTGTRDVLWGDASGYKYIDLQGGVRPWLLTHVANGLGKTTDLHYSTSTQLMLAAAAAKNPWTSVAPMPMHVITQVTDKDNLDAVGRPGGVYVTQYAYRDPVYDGRQREFRGFRSATATRLGDSNSPTSTTSSTFLLGECQNDEAASPDPCTPQGRWEDNPREALKGLPVVSETSDGGSTYRSTTHHTYNLRKLYAGLDGREVRYAFESQSDAYLYDTSPFTAGAQSASLLDVNPEAPVTLPQQGTVTVRASAGLAHTHKSSTVDLFGNATASTDDGASGDESITTNFAPQLVTGDNSGWLYRTVESYIVGNKSPGRWKDTYTQYDSGGNPAVVNEVLQGTLPLDRFHENPSAGIASPPSTASQDGLILVSATQYDQFGRPTQQTAPNGRCRQIAYDGPFDELPTSEIVWLATCAQPPPPSCTNPNLPCLMTQAEYDRGLHAVTRVHDVRQELTVASYDGFGRSTALTKPDPQSVGNASAAASVLVTYCLPGDNSPPCNVPAGAPYSVVRTQTQDGPDPDTSTPSYRNSWAYVDGLGRAIVTLDEADPTLDGGQWIVNGLTSYDAKGAAQRAYRPWFWNGDPLHFPLATTPTSLYGRQRYDAFGRQLQTFGLDGNITLQSAYHALSVDKWDAADLQPGPHQGTYASATQDGHGRTTALTERIHGPGGIEAHDTRTTYLPTGEPTVIARVRVGASDTPVTRWIQYDSLGRMVLNVEPNTTKNFAPAVLQPDGTFVPPTTVAPSMHAWRYAYDANGDLVGTSDARGCGANYAYDAGGRIVAEDFSPCLVTHQDYSTPDLTTGDGTEAYYKYDQLDTDSTSTGLTINTALLKGRLAVVSDRGAKTVTSYDGRGRVVGVARRMAAPGTPSDGLSVRYGAHWFVQTTSYDAADRAVVATTGVDVDVPGLLDPTGQSHVTTTYSKRGTVSKVSSGYGDLVTSIGRDADGLVNQIVYGDVAKTQTTFTYDSRRRPSSVQTYRGPPVTGIWSQQPPAYSPPPNPSGPPSTFQLLLQDLDYVYDAVDNPVEIRDFRNPAEWPAGSQPVTRKIQYDDLYRVTNVAYGYPGGNDTWVSPFDAEDKAIDTDPRRAQPSPHVSFDKRVMSQSFQYDWLGNTTSTDDDVHGFYDRSLGTLTNGSAAKGPYQLQVAQGVAGGARGGGLTAAYDDAGNLTSLAATRSGPCLPSGAECSQRFAYDWDEVGRLVHARRWDLASTGSAADPVPLRPTSAELVYAYDASDQRTLKTAVGAQGGADSQTVYVFGSLELRQTTWNGSAYDYLRNSSTEVGYLDAHGARLARLHYALASEPNPVGASLHVLLELPDHLGSTSLLVDRGTSELVEATSYLPTGAAESDYRPERWNSFREDYEFTGKEEDVEVGLQYFGKRYLSGALGRWASADPLAVHGLGADINVYAYVHGCLLRAVDPVGLDEPSDAGAPTPDGGDKEVAGAPDASSPKNTAPLGSFDNPINVEDLPRATTQPAPTASGPARVASAASPSLTPLSPAPTPAAATPSVSSGSAPSTGEVFSGMIPVSFNQAFPPHVGAVIYDQAQTNWIEDFPKTEDTWNGPSEVHYDSNVGTIRNGPNALPTTDSLQEVMSLVFTHQGRATSLFGVILPGLNVDAARRYAQGAEHNPPTYNFLAKHGSENCASFVYNALDAAGGGQPFTIFFLPDEVVANSGQFGTYFTYSPSTGVTYQEAPTMTLPISATGY